MAWDLLAHAAKHAVVLLNRVLKYVLACLILYHDEFHNWSEINIQLASLGVFITSVSVRRQVRA